MEVETPRLSTPVKRKLTTILASDVESYTRLMRDNDEETLRTLSEYREIIDGLIEKHDGRIFSTAGDSVLAEFTSTVEAVRCAIAFQEEITARNRELPEDRRLRFRIGINVGDVMAKGGTLYGDGVNVAARLEGLAESGGICLSAAAFEQIKHKLSMGFEAMGPRALKNIGEPVSVFRLVPAPVAVMPQARRAAERNQERKERRREREEETGERRRRRSGLRIPFKKTLVLGAVAVLAVAWSDPNYRPTVREVCSHVDMATHTMWQIPAPATLAERARMQESWSWRLQRLWSRARKELCW